MAGRVVSFKKGVRKHITEEGEVLYLPYLILGGIETLYSNRGEVVSFDNRKDAEEYLED